MAKESTKSTNPVTSRVRETSKSASTPAAQPRSAVRTMVAGSCEDCRATNAFQAWHSIVICGRPLGKDSDGVICLVSFGHMSGLLLRFVDRWP